METFAAQMDDFPGMKFLQDATEYAVDSWQRMIGFTDILRQQGNNFIDANSKGLPPVLTFDYEIIFNGRDLDHPVNYSLARIMPEEGADIPLEARPVVIIDPRAGHGPGIGGFKKESEVGVAMKNNHPVYFMMFSQHPVKAQSLAEITLAEIQFLEVIKMLHPKAERPAIIGNCQAGWAMALLAADRPDITGPLILNGSPLSYWAGKDTVNPMRYKGGLLGGTWLALLCADLGNGLFDGANLVKGFEDLNPANTLWKKPYNLYSKIDTEKERYLLFEKWWNGFVHLTKKEIRFITRELFIGNRLEKGAIKSHAGEKLDLKKMRDPIILFASEGDNITPPQQALNWVTRVWGSEEELIRQNQVIIYLLHKDIGHLGIFVSGKVIKREHKEMIGSVDLFGYLAPGLYQMVIDESERDEEGNPAVRFEKRTFDHIAHLEGDNGEDKFRIVDKVSRINEKLYTLFVSPWVRMATTEVSAKLLENLHPLRLPRYLFSDLNPMLAGFGEIAGFVEKNRMPASADNTYKKLEEGLSDMMISSLDCFRDIRDMGEKTLFHLIYDNPAMKLVLGNGELDKDNEIMEIPPAHPGVDPDELMERMTKGGFMEGLIRALIALGKAKRVTDKKQLVLIKNIVDSRKHLAPVSKEDIKRITKEQSNILKFNSALAINTIPKLIKTPEDRLVALEILSASVADEASIGAEEKRLLQRITTLLEDIKTLY